MFLKLKSQRCYINIYIRISALQLGWDCLYVICGCGSHGGLYPTGLVTPEKTRWLRSAETKAAGLNLPSLRGGFFHFAHQQWGVNNGSAHLSAVLIDVSSPFTPSWVLPLTQVEVTGYGGSALCSGVNITANNLPCADKPPAETTGGRFYWIINVLTLQWLHVFYSL